MPFVQVRQCIRKVTTRQSVRACVEEFSKGAPTQACMTSNALLQCAMPSISDKCDQKAATFVRNYVTRFATAVDHSCVITDHETGSIIFHANTGLLFNASPRVLMTPDRNARRGKEGGEGGGFSPLLLSKVARTVICTVGTCGR